MWFVRLPGSRLNPNVAYAGHPTLFTIKLYHGGEFTRFPEVEYIDGDVSYVDNVDIDEFSAHQMDAIMKGLRYSVPPIIYYHFRVPNGDFHFGLRPLGNDADILNLAQYIRDHKLIRVYTEHGTTHLLTYFLNPNPVIKVRIVQLDEIDEGIEEQAGAQIADEVLPASSPPDNHLALELTPEFNRTFGLNMEKRSSSCSKKLFTDDLGGEKEQIANDFEDAAANDFDIGLYKQILQSDFENDFQEFNTQMADDTQVENDFQEFNTQMEADMQADMQAELEKEKEVEREQEIEDEGIQDTEVEVDDSEYSEYSEGSDDSQDSDFWVDEENLIPDVEVDMKDFHMSVDVEAEFMESRVRNPKNAENNDGLVE